MLDDYENEDVISYVEELAKEVTSKSVDDKRKEVYMSGTKKLLWALIKNDYNGDLDDLVTHYATFLRNWSLFDNEFASNYKHLVESLPIESIRLANKRLRTYHRHTLFEYAHEYAAGLFKNYNSQEDETDGRTEVNTETIKSINNQAVIMSLNSLLGKNSKKSKKPIEDIIDDFYLFRCNWKVHDSNFAFLYKELLAEYSDEDFELLEKIFKENGDAITLDIDGRKKANEEQDKVITRDEFQEKLNSCANQGQKHEFITKTFNILLKQIIDGNPTHSQEELIDDFAYYSSLITSSAFNIWLSQVPADKYVRLKGILEKNNLSFSSIIVPLYQSDSLYSKRTENNLSFQQFLDLIPEETLNYLKYVAPYLTTYLKAPSFTIPKKSSFIIEDVSIVQEINRYFIILFTTMANYYPSYLTYFKQAKFNIPEIEQPSKEADLSMIEDILRTYCGKAFQDPLFCSTLLPIDLLDLVFDDFYNHNYQLLAGRLLFGELSSDFVKRTFKSLYDKEHEQYLTLLERKLFEGYPLVVNKYIKNAGIIHHVLLENKAKLGTYDIVPLSLFLSLYFTRQVREKGNHQITDGAAICSILEEHGVSLTTILDSIGVDETDLKDAILMIDLAPVKADSSTLNFSKILPLLRSYYYRYYQDIPKEQLTVSTIFGRLLDTSFVGNLTVDNLLAHFDCSIHLFDTMDQQLIKEKEKLQRLQFVRDKHDFYNELSRDVRNFIDYTAKCDAAIITAMQKGKHDTMLLAHEEDAIGLAFYLASCHFENDLGIFFMDHDVTPSALLSYLKLPLTEEQIQQSEMSFYELSNKFRALIFEGENRNLISSDITMRSLISNFVNTQTVPFEFLKNTFESFQRNSAIEKDFMKQMDTYLEEKEKHRLAMLEQTFFENLSDSVQDYLKEACAIYLQYYKEDSKDPKKVASALENALFYVRMNEESKVIKRYLEKHPVNFTPNLKIQSIDPNYDIDVLVNQFSPFITGGVNDGKDREAITIASIFENAYRLEHSKEKNPLDDFDSKIAQFIEEENQEAILRAQKMQEEKELSYAQKTIASFSSEEARDYMKKVLLIHSYLRNEYPKQSSYSDAAIQKMSLLLALYFVPNQSVPYFERQNLTLAKITKYFDIDPLTLKMLNSDSINYRLFFDQYLPYFTKTMETTGIEGALNGHIILGDPVIDEEKKTIEGMAKFLFDKEVGVDPLLKEVTQVLGADYEILKYEVTTLKDYDLSLDLETRISRLLNTPITQLDLNDMKSILYFGDSVYNHLRYIQDALPSASELASTSKALQPINEIKEKIYLVESVEKPRKGILKYFPKKLLDTLLGPNLVEEKILDPNALPYLQEVLDGHIHLMTDQVAGYDAIRRYIEAHKAKNEELMKVAREAYKQARKKELSLSRDKSKMDEYFNWKSKREVMESKVRRLKESEELLKQQLVQINQIMSSHMITIDGLERSKEVFMPIIGSQFAIQAGLTTQNYSLELTQRVMNLMNSMITRNRDQANENVKLLHNYSLTDDTVEKVESTIDTFFERIDDLNQPLPLHSIEPIDVTFTDLSDVDREIASEDAVTSPSTEERAPFDAASYVVTNPSSPSEIVPKLEVPTLIAPDDTLQDLNPTGLVLPQDDASSCEEDPPKILHK